MNSTMAFRSTFPSLFTSILATVDLTSSSIMGPQAWMSPLPVQVLQTSCWIRVVNSYREKEFFSLWPYDLKKVSTLRSSKATLIDSYLIFLHSPLNLYNLQLWNNRQQSSYGIINLCTLTVILQPQPSKVTLPERSLMSFIKLSASYLQEQYVGLNPFLNLLRLFKLHRNRYQIRLTYNIKQREVFLQ